MENRRVTKDIAGKRFAFWVMLLLLAGPFVQGSARFDFQHVLVQPVSVHARDQLPDFNAPPEASRSLDLVSRATFLYKLQVLPGETVEHLIYTLGQSGLINFAEPDFLLKKHAMPDDPEFLEGNQWALWNTGQAGGTSGSDIQAVTAWNVRHDASNVVVAIIDSGVHYTHEDLVENIWRNTNEIAGNAIDDDLNGYVDDLVGIYPAKISVAPLDDEGHGTHIAGILGARGNNGLGITGVAWSVKIMPLRLFDDEGFGRYSDAIKCIDYARENGASIINASWGDANFSEGLLRAFSEARNAGLIVVTSAGNDGMDIDADPIYPASFSLDNIIVVSTSNRRDEFDWAGANYGKRTVDLMAPGLAIYSTWPIADDAYAFNSGTSMAAPMVSGSLALMKAEYPLETAQELRARLLRAVDRIPEFEELCVTGGRLNLARALQEWIELRIEKTAQGMSVQFEQRAGGTYVLESSSDFQQWVEEGRETVQASGLVRVDLDGSQEARFFRVRRE